MFLQAAALVVGIHVMAAPASCQLPSPITPLRAEEGQRALKEARYSEAWRVLEPMARAPKATAQVRFWAAEAALKLQLYSEALVFLMGLEADLAAVSDEIYARKARCHTALGHLDEALGAWHEMLLRNPPAALGHEARYGLGALWLAKNNPVAAVMAYKNALNQGPKDTRAAEARLRVAGLEEAQGNWKDAKKELAHLVATAKDPVAQEAAEALAQLARAHPEVREDPKAGGGAEEGDAAPSWQTVSSVRDAQRMVGQKRPDAAVDSLRKLLRHGSRGERVAVATSLGNMLAQLGRTDEAIQVFDNLAQSLPAGTRKQDAQFRAAFLSYDGHHYATAKARFGRFLGTHPKYRSADEALWFSAWCGFHLGHYDDAIADLTRLRRQFPKSSLVPRAQWWLARLLRLRHRDKEARAQLADLARGAGYYGMLARQDQSGQKTQPSPTGLQPGLKATLTLWNPNAHPNGENGDRPFLTTQIPDEEMLAFVLAQGTQVLDWSGPQGARVSTLIALGLSQEAAGWVGAVRGLPGVHSRDQALGRGQILYALGDYTQAMRQAVPLLPDALVDDPSPWQEMALKLAYPPAYVVEVTAAGRAGQVSELLLLSLMRQESAFNSRASSQVSAQGLMQIMPSTARRIAKQLDLHDYSDSELLAPELNIRFAGWYMGALMQRFGNNLPVAIGSYNAGPKVVHKWLQASERAATDVFVEDIPFRETRDYVKKVLANLEMYSRIYGGAMPNWPSTVAPSAGGVDF